MAVFENSKHNKVLLLVSSIVVLFRLIGYAVDIYQFAFTGAIFEVLNFPTLALLFGLPFYGLYLFWKDGFNLKSLALYSTLILVLTITILILMG